jgi:hypothetical protein
MYKEELHKSYSLDAPSARKAVQVAPNGGVSASTTIVVDASLFIVVLGENIFFVT